MRPLSDALDLLASQHEEIDELFDRATRGDSTAFDELSHRIVEHLACEQEVFYPAIASSISPDVMSELLAEHVAIKRALAELVWRGTEDTEFAAKLAVLGTLLAGHSSWQEDELFPRAEATLSRAELAKLCDRFELFPLAA